MAVTLTSEFVSPTVNCTEARRDGTNNYEAPRSEFQIGDTEKLVQNDARKSMFAAYDMGNPTVGLAIPKACVITKVTYTFTPSQTNSQVRNPAVWFVFSMAHAASDGYWDRGNLHPLSLDVSGNQYGPPLYASVLSSAAYDADNNLLATTSTQSHTPAYGANTTSFFNIPETQSFGSTFLMPAGEELSRISLHMNQRRGNPTSLPDVEMHIKLFTLHKNGRQYAFREAIALTESRMYNSLTRQNTNSSTLPHTLEDWTFSQPVPAFDEDTWVGWMLEGDWFHPDYIPNYHIVFKSRLQPTGDGTSYMPGSNGSQLWGSNDSRGTNYNGVQDYYYDSIDLPILYPELVDDLVETPYPRYFGSVMRMTGADFDNQIKSWTADVPYQLTSGDNISGDNAISSFGTAPVTNMQSWIDSDDYDPASGKTWTGLILEVPDSDNRFWWMHGSSAAESKRPKLTIEYELLPPTITSSTLDGNFPLDLQHVDIPETNQVAIIWVFQLTSDTLDVLKVPGLQNLDSISILEDNIDLSPAAMLEGEHLVSITGSGMRAGKRVTVVSLHRVGHINNLTIDDNPT